MRPISGKIRKDKMYNNQVVIGWIGTQSTFKYLLLVKDVLNRLIADYNVLVHIVGAKESLELGENEIHINWSEATEIDSILQFDIGIMPLLDTPWEQGKCAYKLIQYMACGLPVVASAVGANNDIVEHGKNGFLVNNELEWIQSIELYILNSELASNHGKYGRNLVENKYCITKQLDKYLEIYKTIKK
jgi:glycosyltransferase involved in cell wall biosynthesis